MRREQAVNLANLERSQEFRDSAENRYRNNQVIRPTVEQLGQTDDILRQAVAGNVQSSVARLRTDEPILSPLSKSGVIKIVGAVYDVKTGIVRVLE